MQLDQVLGPAHAQIVSDLSTQTISAALPVRPKMKPVALSSQHPITSGRP